MSEEPKLLDCPFCGGAPQIHTQMSSRYQFMSCSRCRCDGPLKERARDAISHWNRRASPTPPTTEGRGEGIYSPNVRQIAEAIAARPDLFPENHATMLMARAITSSPPNRPLT